MQPAGIQLTWAEFRTAFRAHYIPEGVMAMKLDEFLALKQGDQTVMQYVGKFNHCRRNIVSSPPRGTPRW